MSQPKRGINNQVFALRRNRRFRQKHLARLLGHRKVAMLSEYERGKSLPPIKTAILLEIALGAKLSEIYIDLYRELEQLVLKRSELLPDELARSVRGRILRKD